jgi:hypothetical protein
MLLEVAHPIATQLEPAETAQLAAHLAECPDCGYLAEVERRVDEKFAAAMRDVPMPEGLKERIGRHLQVERDAWWRVRVTRVAGAAVAACVLVWLSYAFWFSKRSDPDLQQVLSKVDQRESGPQVVEQFFDEMGVPMRAPRRFNYDFLVAYNLAVFPDTSKKLVPCLVFVRQQKNGAAVTAQVFVLSDRTFDIASMDSAQPLIGSHQNIAVHTETENPRVAYVVIYTGESVRAFWKENKPIQ